LRTFEPAIPGSFNVLDVVKKFQGDNKKDYEYEVGYEQLINQALTFVRFVLITKLGEVD
jgi:hypothetical protein